MRLKIELFQHEEEQAGRSRVLLPSDDTHVYMYKRMDDGEERIIVDCENGRGRRGEYSANRVHVTRGVELPDEYTIKDFE